MPTGEIAAMISVKDGGNPTESPAWISFTPDGLVERQRSLKCCGIGKSQEIARYASAKVIENDRQPRSSRLTTFIKQPDRQERMVGLPDNIGCIRFKTIDQIKRISISRRAFMG